MSPETTGFPKKPRPSPYWAKLGRPPVKRPASPQTSPRIAHFSPITQPHTARTSQQTTAISDQISNNFPAIPILQLGNSRSIRQGSIEAMHSERILRSSPSISTGIALHTRKSTELPRIVYSPGRNLSPRPKGPPIKLHGKSSGLRLHSPRGDHSPSIELLFPGSSGSASRLDSPRHDRKTSSLEFLFASRITPPSIPLSEPLPEPTKAVKVQPRLPPESAAHVSSVPFLISQETQKPNLQDSIPSDVTPPSFDLLEHDYRSVLHLSRTEYTSPPVRSQSIEITVEGEPSPRTPFVVSAEPSEQTFVSATTVPKFTDEDPEVSPGLRQTVRSSSANSLPPNEPFPSLPCISETPISKLTEDGLEPSSAHLPTVHKVDSAKVLISEQAPLGLSYAQTSPRIIFSSQLAEPSITEPLIDDSSPASLPLSYETHFSPSIILPPEPQPRSQEGLLSGPGLESSEEINQTRLSLSQLVGTQVTQAVIQEQEISETLASDVLLKGHMQARVSAPIVARTELSPPLISEPVLDGIELNRQSLSDLVPTEAKEPGVAEQGVLESLNSELIRKGHLQARVSPPIVARTDLSPPLISEQVLDGIELNRQSQSNLVPIEAKEPGVAEQGVLESSNTELIRKGHLQARVSPPIVARTDLSPPLISEPVLDGIELNRQSLSDLVPTEAKEPGVAEQGVLESSNTELIRKAHLQARVSPPIVGRTELSPPSVSEPVLDGIELNRQSLSNLVPTEAKEPAVPEAVILEPLVSDMILEGIPQRAKALEAQRYVDQIRLGESTTILASSIAQTGLDSQSAVRHVTASSPTLSGVEKSAIIIEERSYSPVLINCDQAEVAEQSIKMICFADKRESTGAESRVIENGYGVSKATLVNTAEEVKDSERSKPLWAVESPIAIKSPGDGFANADEFLRIYNRDLDNSTSVGPPKFSIPDFKKIIKSRQDAAAGGGKCNMSERDVISFDTGRKDEVNQEIVTKKKTTVPWFLKKSEVRAKALIGPGLTIISPRRTVQVPQIREAAEHPKKQIRHIEKPSTPESADGQPKGKPVPEAELVRCLTDVGLPGPAIVYQTALPYLLPPKMPLCTSALESGVKTVVTSDGLLHGKLGSRDSKDGLRASTQGLSSLPKMELLFERDSKRIENGNNKSIEHAAGGSPNAGLVRLLSARPSTGLLELLTQQSAQPEFQPTSNEDEYSNHELDGLSGIGMPRSSTVVPFRYGPKHSRKDTIVDSLSRPTSRRLGSLLWTQSHKDYEPEWLRYMPSAEEFGSMMDSSEDTIRDSEPFVRPPPVVGELPVTMANLRLLRLCELDYVLLVPSATEEATSPTFLERRRSERNAEVGIQTDIPPVVQDFDTTMKSSMQAANPPEDDGRRFTLIPILDTSSQDQISDFRVRRVFESLAVI